MGGEEKGKEGRGEEARGGSGEWGGEGIPLTCLATGL